MPLADAQGSGLPATLFGLSSQSKTWSFSAASLSAARLKSNVTSAAKVRESLAAEAELQQRSLGSSHSGNTESVKEDFKDIETLSPEEQLAFTRYWEAKIMNYCTVFRLDRVVQVCFTPCSITQRDLYITSMPSIKRRLRSRSLSGSTFSTLSWTMTRGSF